MKDIQQDNKQTTVYPDIWYQVDYQWNNPKNFEGLYFTVYRIDALAEEDEGTNELDPNEILKGHIKWDGCMNVESGNNHFCGRGNTRQYAQLLEKLYDRAVEVGCTD